jgi:hypothetical protein
VEILIELQNLVEILLLHLGTRLAHPAVVFGEENLVDYDVVNVDLELGELLDQTLGLVHRQEFGDANRDEGRFGAVLHLLVYYLGGLAHLFHLPEDPVQGLVHVLFAPENGSHLVEQAVELLLEGQHLVETLLENAREVQEAQGVARGGSVEHDDLEVHLLDRTRSLSVYLISCEKDIASSMPGTEEIISLSKLFVDSSDSKKLVSNCCTSTFGSISCVAGGVPSRRGFRSR